MGKVLSTNNKRSSEDPAYNERQSVIPAEDLPVLNQDENGRRTSSVPDNRRPSTSEAGDVLLSSSDADDGRTSSSELDGGRRSSSESDNGPPSSTRAVSTRSSVADIGSPSTSQEDFNRPSTSQDDFNRPSTSQEYFNRPSTSQEEFNRPSTSRADFNRPRSNLPTVGRLSRPVSNLPDAGRPRVHRDDSVRRYRSRATNIRPIYNQGDNTRSINCWNPRESRPLEEIVIKGFLIRRSYIFEDPRSLRIRQRYMDNVNIRLIHSISELEEMETTNPLYRLPSLPTYEQAVSATPPPTYREATRGAGEYNMIAQNSQTPEQETQTHQAAIYPNPPTYNEVPKEDGTPQPIQNSSHQEPQASNQVERPFDMFDDEEPPPPYIDEIPSSSSEIDETQRVSFEEPNTINEGNNSEEHTTQDAEISEPQSSNGKAVPLCMTQNFNPQEQSISNQETKLDEDIKEIEEAPEPPAANAAMHGAIPRYRAEMFKSRKPTKQSAIPVEYFDGAQFPKRQASHKETLDGDKAMGPWKKPEKSGTNDKKSKYHYPSYEEFRFPEPSTSRGNDFEESIIERLEQISVAEFDRNSSQEAKITFEEFLNKQMQNDPVPESDPESDAESEGARAYPKRKSKRMAFRQ